MNLIRVCRLYLMFCLLCVFIVCPRKLTKTHNHFFFPQTTDPLFLCTNIHTHAEQQMLIILALRQAWEKSIVNREEEEVSTLHSTQDVQPCKMCIQYMCSFIYYMCMQSTNTVSLCVGVRACVACGHKRPVWLRWQNEQTAGHHTRLMTACRCYDTVAPAILRIPQWPIWMPAGDRLGWPKTWHGYMHTHRAQGVIQTSHFLNVKRRY